MPDITDYEIDAGDCQIGINRIKSQNRNTQIHLRHPGKHTGTVDQITPEILPEKVSFCFEYKIFVAQKNIGHSDNIGKYPQQQIVLLPEDYEQKSITSDPENRIPATDDDITDPLSENFKLEQLIQNFHRLNSGKKMLSDLSAALKQKQGQLLVMSV